jgi:uncharacterized protein
MPILFKKAKELETAIDEYLDVISSGLIVFGNGVRNYLLHEESEFADKLVQIDKYEAKADSLRRSIENELYRLSLIPEHRGDVLGLLENLDNVIDSAKKTIFQFDVEIPRIPGQFNNEYLNLVDASIHAAEAVICASRAFFKNVNFVKDHLHKVYFFEKEADRIGNKLKRSIFRSDLELSQKIHLRYFALHIEDISDRAEEVADRLSIYTIKREM